MLGVWLCYIELFSIKNAIKRIKVGPKVKVGLWTLNTEDFVFSTPEAKVPVHNCDHVLSVIRWSSIGLSSVINFSHFRLLLWNHWTEFNKTISISSTNFVFYRPIKKTRWSPRHLIGWDIFDFCSESVDRNSTKLDRKQDITVFYQVCVFLVDRKNKMAAPACDWLTHFLLLLWNSCMEFNEAWQEARSQSPLASLFFMPIRKIRWPPRPLIGGYIFSSLEPKAWVSYCHSAPSVAVRP